MTLLVGAYTVLKSSQKTIFFEFHESDALSIAQKSSFFILPGLLVILQKCKYFFTTKKLLLFFTGLYCIFLIFLIFVLSFKSYLTDQRLSIFVGYAWYISIECFGALLISVFWGYILETLKDLSFSSLAFLGQLGGVFIPLFIKFLSKNLAQTLAMNFILLTGLFLIILSLPKASVQPEKSKVSKKQGFSLQKLIKENHLILGILGVQLCHSFLISLFDFFFEDYAVRNVPSAHLSQYFYYQMAATNGLAIFLHWFLRKKNMGVKSLFCIPCLVFIGSLIFSIFPKTHTLFGITILLKLICYTIADPNMKKLYLPLVGEVKSTAHTWISIGGNLFSRQMACFAHAPVSLWVTSQKIPLIALCVPIVMIWIFCICLAKKKPTLEVDKLRRVNE